MKEAPHEELAIEVPTANDLETGVTPFVQFQLTQGAISDSGATPWTTNMGLGTPPQTLRFMLDTGTLNTWISAISSTVPRIKQVQFLCTNP
jgi:hypothetical protein